MVTKADIQKEALQFILPLNRCGVAISVGVGKTKLALEYITEQLLKGKRKILVVAPKLSIIEGWKSEIVKHQYEILGDFITYTTYLSLTKQSLDWDVVILDEMHSLIEESHNEWLNQYTGNILGLTGTPPRKHSSKRSMIDKYCPIVFEYKIDEAIDNNLLNDYKIIVHYLNLDIRNNLEIVTKNKSFYTSELKNYQYWSGRLKECLTPKQKQITSIMRMQAMKNYKSKEIYGKRLFDEQTDKTILFCNTQEQADVMYDYSYHSKNPESEFNLELFKRGMIDKLTSVLQLTEGVNIFNLKVGIILHSYSGSSSKLFQRLGRLVRLNPNEVCTLHILCYKNTIDEQWVNQNLENFNQQKIEYVSN